MKTIFEQIKEKKVLVAAHRGSSRGNIPPNTIAAFDIALKEGADIVEMDLFQSTDGEIFVFHTGMEPCQLDRHLKIEKLSSERIRNLRYCNCELNETLLPLNTLDEVLEHLKGKCFLNLDRCVMIVEDVMKSVRRHGMQDQILLKSAPTPDCLRLIEAYAPDVCYTPVFHEKDTASERIQAMNITYSGAELVFASEDAPIVQEAYMKTHHDAGRFLFCNALRYSSYVPLSAGRDDDLSLTQSEDAGWGWLVDKGFDIIQTDWTYHLVNYLNRKIR